jgi:hypothetical protein
MIARGLEYFAERRVGEIVRELALGIVKFFLDVSCICPMASLRRQLGWSVDDRKMEIRITAPEGPYLQLDSFGKDASRDNISTEVHDFASGKVAGETWDWMGLQRCMNAWRLGLRKGSGRLLRMRWWKPRSSRRVGISGMNNWNCILFEHGSNLCLDLRLVRHCAFAHLDTVGKECSDSPCTSSG